MLRNLKAVAWVSFFLAIFVVPLAHGQQTILVANFMNGNNGALNSRIYLWNPSDSPGDITVRVYTLPLRSGSPQELTGAPFSLGALGSRSAVNLKLAEDILIPLGIITPYVTDGGNLTLEFTIGAENVRGVAQVFSGSFAFGTYPLLETTSVIIGSAQLADQVDFGATGSRGLVRMLNNTGTAVAALGTSLNTDAGRLDLASPTGNSVVSLGASATNPNTGALVLRNSEGTSTVTLQSTDVGGTIFLNSTSSTVVALAAGADGSGGALVLLDTDGNPTALLANTVGSGGSVQTYSPSGVVLTHMGPTTSGHGLIQTQNTTGNVIVRISSLSGGTGTIDVRNASGTRTAGMDGLTGLVFGNTKSFIVDDPTDSDRMIKYTSLEGPEAAIYVRGTADLVSGQAYIGFPDHFTAMAVQSSTTVTLTPRSASSMGLAAVNVSSQGIEVAELGGGTNSYSFDYVAYAVRKGFEDYEVYLTQQQARGLTGQAQALELQPRTLLTTSPLKAIQRQE